MDVLRWLGEHAAQQAKAKCELTSILSCMSVHGPANTYYLVFKIETRNEYIYASFLLGGKSVLSSVHAVLWASEQASGAYYELANDWAFAIPMAEMAERPGVVAAPLYLYERATPQDLTEEREAAIAEIMARPSYAQAGEAAGSHVAPRTLRYTYVRDEWVFQLKLCNSFEKYCLVYMWRES